MSVTYSRSVVFSGYSVSSTNKTDFHNITEILLKVVLKSITPLHINANSRWPNARLPEGSPRDSETRLTLVTCYNKQTGTVLKTDVKMLKRWQSWHLHSSTFIIVRLNKDKNRFSLIWYLTGTSCYHVKADVSSIKY